MGADIAKSATSYNYLNHKEVEELGEALVGCRTAANPESCRNDAVQHFKEISGQKTNLALNGCRNEGESGCSNQRVDIENATDLLDSLITRGGYSQAERDILQDFSDSNFHDWQLGQNLWLKEFLKESGVVGGALVGAGIAVTEVRSATTPDDLTGFYANPKDIRFTQDSVSNGFKDGRSLQKTIDGLKSGRISPRDLPPIRIFEKDGLIYTLDNRRLMAASAAGVSVKIIRATESEIIKQLSRKLSTKNEGTIICIRGSCK